MIVKIRPIRFAFAVCALSTASWAQVAGEVQVAVDTPTPLQSAAMTVSSNDNPFNAKRLTEDALKGQAGREDTAMVAQSANTATVARNNVGDNSTTGEVRVADQAFQNLSGLSLLNINTGNNVAINASMNVNISITPGQ